MSLRAHLRVYGWRSVPCFFFGCWLANVEENVARCRVCGCLSFCSHATSEQIERLILGD